ncbi:hypothetical protein [Novosphingobium album (ex Liu et al. 2023)]|uniref:DUF4148 domain-containing protein n=1 Tax=Novosphingobium album (ex Liu et al. 2023) TaxID=3031130 RepID=A0ABT5WK41_9SPHN|nr:hypothetical protein [Novosphingobium album (ex Liu et al. 2023)]MDE8650410.1 hypothetical protein [Novosphingobium album (ex Liu et al. 2023)]
MPSTLRNIGRLALTGIALTVFAVPASAQIAPRAPPGSESSPDIFDVGPHDAAIPLDRKLDDARDSIHRGRKNGELSKAEARALRKDARLTGTLADRYGQDGTSDAERRELDTRVQVLQSMTNAQRFQTRQKP